MNQLTSLLLLSAALLAAPAVQAQSTSKPAPKSSTTEARIDLQNGDQFVMQNGAVVRRRDGQTTGLNQNVRLPNGTKINVKSGIVELSNGKITTLKEGDYVKADGGIIFATPQSAAEARGTSAPADAKFGEYVERGAAPTGNLDARLADMNRRVDLMAQKIQLLNQKISLLSQGNSKAPDTSQLDGQIRSLDEQLRAVK
ncbi:hypothetical protein F0P96_13325 [Hymenobacter busanensis]|uniref:Uncharacterized protein n=1 Tax=Hymenobacter busanensis TaxID=2607656 RepID=A0A7L4ZUV5_9BACT|nr:DUF6799 domain-containing protein [Hymenobacter busanensis]KAA9332448.1 hypothetical protein F0P96_13325 [Hymenobacter busanensis]QHJ07214.1 hypothetical protein GUY19_07945 [Hymenobacter busanensis]